MRAASRPQATSPLTRETYTRLVEAIVDQMAFEVVGVDPEGRVRFVNRAAARRLPDPGGAIGRPLFDVFPFFAASGRIAWRTVVLENVLREGRSVEARDVLHEGRHYDVRAFPLKAGKRLLGGAVVLDDVTERVSREEESLRQARTASLANLGASIAHEIRNPLNSIALNIQLLKEDLARAAPAGAGTEPFARTIDTTLHGIERLNRIIKEFLQFARPPQVVLKMDDPNRAVLSALHLLEGQVRRSGVDVTVSLAALPQVLMDAERLSEAIYNVALNAIQAMEGRPQRVMAVTSAMEGDHVAIRIRDSGPGIPEENLPRLFDLFFTTREGGTGLGLPYAEGVVKAHQGTIRAENVPGGGAQFTILIPVSIRMAGADAAAVP